MEVSVVLGSDRNIKITKPGDMDLAHLFLREDVAQGAVLSEYPHRTGLGRSPHRAGPSADSGRRDGACEFGLEGHSDADVLAHAITDAILGAAALGDIGMHFPDTDPRWKGCDSLVFLRHARELAEAQGYRIGERGFDGDSGAAEAEGLPAGHSRITGGSAGTRGGSGVGEVQNGGESGAGGRRTLGRSASSGHDGAVRDRESHPASQVAPETKPTSGARMLLRS